VGSRNETSRDEWVERILQEIPAGSRLLDAGAGEQPYRRFCNHCEYLAQDFARYDPQTNEVGFHAPSWNYHGLDIVSDIANIPIADNSFDVILCTEVLEHIPAPVDTLKEFSRLLRPGGQLILTAPFCSLTHQSPFHFSTGFNRYFYEKYLPQLGFEIRELQTNGNYFEYLAQELQRLPKVAVRYSRQHARLWSGVILLLLVFLQKCSKSDRGSSELLNFGYHIRASRKYREPDTREDK
jgi:ubiquinone/menaquinone biosynthesis C-methylase UbiE